MSADVSAWMTRAREKVKREPITEKDLDELAGLLGRAGDGGASSAAGSLRQRLLYLTCSGMNTHTGVVAWDFREPSRRAEGTRLTPNPKPPYASVHDAIMDGWRVIHFPNRDAPIDDREVNVWGYEFILEKMEVIRD